ncbi:MAG: CvpA family protein [Lentilactobacillus diolivorans]
MVLSLLILILLVGGLMSGYRAGLITQSVRIISLILSFIVAFYYFQPAANLVMTVVKRLGAEPNLQWIYIIDIIAFVFLFGLTHTVYLMLGNHLNGIAKVPGFHIGNAILGSAVGLLTQYLVIFFVLNILVVFPINWIQDQYRQSDISQTIVKKTPVLSGQFSRNLIKNKSFIQDDTTYRYDGGTINEVDK